MQKDTIPIQNVYYLFLYAWDRFPEGKAIDVGGSAGLQLPNLLAKVLLSCTKTLLKRGLDRDYKPIIAELAGPRGRFLLNEFLKRNTLVAGRIVCAFDELSIDTLPNRIIKAALKALSHIRGVDPALRHELAATAKRMSEVSDARFSRQMFRALQIVRSNGRYGLAMQVCRLAVDLLLPEEEGSGFRFNDILENEERMSTIFEHFIRNFYRSEQTRFTSNAEHIRWDVECDGEVSRFIPEMKTDITLRSTERTIVIDTKYYQQTFVTHYTSTQPKVRSEHLYQIQTYLRNMEGRAGTDSFAEGLLLYPLVGGEPVRLDMRLSGHRTRIWTVDLTKPWQVIHAELISALE